MENFNVTFGESSSIFSADFGEVQIVKEPLDPYSGDYIVTPKIHTQVILETKDKSMSDNVTVLKVPQYEVSNPQGGLTLTIGDDNLN